MFAYVHSRSTQEIEKEKERNDLFVCFVQPLLRSIHVTLLHLFMIVHPIRKVRKQCVIKKNANSVDWGCTHTIGAVDMNARHTHTMRQ